MSRASLRRSADVDGAGVKAALEELARAVRRPMSSTWSLEVSHYADAAERAGADVNEINDVQEAALKEGEPSRRAPARRTS